MTNQTINRDLSSSSQKNKLNIKLLIFEIGKLTLALPILQVQKVIRYNPLHGSGLSYVNLTHLDNQEIAIVDLHQKLFHTSSPKTSNQKGYFIITKNNVRESLGILVAKTPELINISAEQIRLIPDTYRQADTLKIASHVMVINLDNEIKKTIFILDLETLIN